MNCQNMEIKLKNGFTLFHHQVETMKWMEKREASKEKGIKGGIVCHTMGLGKTLTALAFSFQNKGKFPTLIVTSKTVLSEWKHEGVEKFFITQSNEENGTGGAVLNALYLHRDYLGKGIEKIDREQLMKYDIVITTYDVCVSTCHKGKYYEQCLETEENNFTSINCRRRKGANLSKLKGTAVIYGTPWGRVICDESQRFSNPKTKIYKYMMAIYGKYKWCLSGTPIRNYETDIWTQLRFCGYHSVNNHREWNQNGHKIFKEERLSDAIFLIDYSSTKIQLPEKYENEIKVSLTGKHREVYEEFLNETRVAYKKMMLDLCSFTNVLAMFTRLRQCAIAPYLITPDAKRTRKTKKQNQDAWHLDKDGEAGILSCKIQKIVSIIKEVTYKEKKDVFSLKTLAQKAVRENFHADDLRNMHSKHQGLFNNDHPTKVIVFSMFTSCLDLLGDALRTSYPTFKFVQIDGSTTNRTSLLDKFKIDPAIQGLLLTYKVGSEGLNLTEATHCICVEPWWTNSVHNQAKARCWRTGQTKPVHVHNIIIEGSIEERIVEVCKGKDDMASSYLKGTERTFKAGPKLDKYTLGKMLGMKF
ncbi:SNF2 family DNA/RNA helicase [Armadillidium vulgare iridescent virus]|uniref:SNF2 family DNA/RNA helicase n=1 Tax=Armadillidium vulgare iridescent virus TaxID=72201 RepID=A0A068QL41_9VIRU|nr:SNF2 family DNA/RNA helicase [Armadillidium vulgare iridescent virus]CCV02455.1 SNF2 family DNA/RNA helicase [Armadillidium vulgare iridescent virus]